MLALIIDAYSLIIFVSVITSWMQLPPDHPVACYSHKLTAPLLNPLRQILPSVGGMDFSPMLLLIGLQMLKRALMGLGS
ncbi:MAG: YggT family protein [Myxococcales bacterium]|jgi:YggT family protein